MFIDHPLKLMSSTLPTIVFPLRGSKTPEIGITLTTLLYVSAKPYLVATMFPSWFLVKSPGKLSSAETIIYPGITSFLSLGIEDSECVDSLFVGSDKDSVSLFS